MKKFFIFTLVVSTLTLTAFWGGKQVYTMRYPGGIRLSQDWYAGLGFSSNEVAALRARESAFREKADKLCMRICDERLDLLNRMKDQTQSREGLYRKIDEIGILQTALEKEIAAHIMDIRNSLTPEQSQVYLDRIQNQFRESLKESGYGEILSKLR